jgi:hypothetical protein
MCPQRMLILHLKGGCKAIIRVLNYQIEHSISLQIIWFNLL